MYPYYTDTPAEYTILLPDEIKSETQTFQGPKSQNTCPCIFISLPLILQICSRITVYLLLRFWQIVENGARLFFKQVQTRWTIFLAPTQRPLVDDMSDDEILVCNSHLIPFSLHSIHLKVLNT